MKLLNIWCAVVAIAATLAIASNASAQSGFRSFAPARSAPVRSLGQSFSTPSYSAAPVYSNNGVYQQPVQQNYYSPQNYSGQSFPTQGYSQSFASPTYATPTYASPSYSSAPSTYATPAYSAPAYSAPRRS